MRSLKSMVLFVAGTLGAVIAAALSSNAFALPQDPSVTAKLVPLAGNEEVTLSRPATNQSEALITYAAYQLTITNNTTNALNRVYLNATANNVGGVDAVKFDSSIIDVPSDPCTGYGTATLSCRTSVSLAAGGGTFSFIVVVRAPSTGQQIKIDWSAGGYEGSGVGNGCCAVTGDPALTNLVDPTTNPSYTTQVKTFLKNSGGRLFTGDRWITKPFDPITTLVVVPGFTAAYDLGQIKEDPATDQALDCATQAHFLVCYQSDISLPKVDFSKDAEGAAIPPTNFLTIVLRIDSSMIKPGTKIEDVKLYYVDEKDPLKVPNPVYQCTYGTDLTQPTNPPCWNKRVQYKRNVEGWTSELDKDFEWEFKHFKNGSWRIL
jgi:hypothetical protein